MKPTLAGSGRGQVRAECQRQRIETGGAQPAELDHDELAAGPQAVQWAGELVYFLVSDPYELFFSTRRSFAFSFGFRNSIE